MRNSIFTITSNPCIFSQHWLLKKSFGNEEKNKAHSNVSRIHVVCPSTLILPGEAKADLADFDIKFPTKFLCTGISKNTYSCRNVLQICLYFIQKVNK
jgi:hypothetical protein